MIRKVSLGKYLMPLVAGVALIGCGGEDEPTPTPVPPMNDYHRVTSLTLGNSSTGVDVDGDGTVDNNIEVALETITATALSAVETALITAGIPFGDECEPQTPPCGDTIMDQVENIFEQAFSVETLSEALSAPVESGDVNYIMQFQEAGAGVDLNWYLGEFVDTEIVPTTVLGKQPGSLDASQNGAFGPGALTLTFSFTTTDPDGNSNTYTIPITLYNGRTEVMSYNTDRLDNITTGGAVSIDDLLLITLDALETVNDLLPPEVKLTEEELQTIIDTAATALLPLADINLDSDAENEGFSIGLKATAKFYEFNQE